MPEPRIENAILTRQFDLRDGGMVDIHVWAPVEVTPNVAHSCAYKITGIGAEKLRLAHGVDDVQALSFALQTIGVWLYTSQEYKDGNLTWLGGRDLGLPLRPGEKAGEDRYEKADLLTTGGQSAVVQIPGDRFAYFAWPGERMDGLVRRLEHISTKIEINSPEARKKLEETIKELVNEQKYFEAVCRGADVDLSYVKAGREE